MEQRDYDSSQFLSNFKKDHEKKSRTEIMDEEDSDEERQQLPNELSKDMLKAMMMNEFKKSAGISKEKDEDSKNETIIGGKISGHVASGNLAGPYLENVYIRAPQLVSYEAKRRPLPGFSDKSKLEALNFNGNSFGKQTENKGEKLFPSENHTKDEKYEELSTYNANPIQVGSILNELDPHEDRFSILFGQKVDRQRLLEQSRPEEPDPMFSIFHKQIDQELTETDETIKKEKLKSRLDKLRSLVSKNSVDLGDEV